MSEPEAVLDAWNKATEYAADLFSDAAGMTRGKAGNFFLDWIPPAENVAGLWVSGGQDNVPFRGDNPPTELRMDWKTEGRFEEPEQARRYASAIMAVLPVRAVSNIQVMRPKGNAIPTIEGKYFKMVDGRAPMLLFVVEFAGELVFNIGRAYD